MNKNLIFILLAVLLILSISQVNAFNWTDGSLVSYYRFDETTGAVVTDVLGTNNGDNINSTTIGVAGKSGTAYNFTQINKYVKLNYTSSYSNNTGSVSFWTYPYYNYQDYGWFSTKPSAAGDVRFKYDASNSSRLNYETGGSTSAFVNITPTWLNNWHHVVITWYSDKKTSLYLDGVFQGNSSNSQAPKIIYFWIGAVSVTSRIANASIDELSIFNKTLDSSQVTELYNSGNGLFYPYLNVTLLSPTNNSDVSNSNQLFRCNATSNNILKNVTFYLWNSTGNSVWQDTQEAGNIISSFYQENANNTILSGTWTNGTNTYDGDWNSYGYSIDGDLFLNYTKPVGSTSAIWRVKDGNAEVNLTIPSSCFNYNLSKILLYARSYFTGGLYLTSWRCYGDRRPPFGDYGWVYLRLRTDTNQMYENGIYWRSASGTDYATDNNFSKILPYSDTYLWNCKVENDYNSLFAQNNYTLNFVPNVTIVNETYPTDVLELSNYNFTETIQKSDNLTTITPTFYYNGTAYTTGIIETISGGNITYSKEINIPYITQSNLYLNKTSYWSFNISYGGTSHLQNSTTKQILNHKMALNNLSACAGDYTYEFYNLSYKDEITETALTAITNTWNFELINPENTTITRIFNGSVSGNRHAWCGHYFTSSNYFQVKSLTSEVERTNYTLRRDYVCEKANTTVLTPIQYLMLNTTDYQKFYFNIKDKYQSNLQNTYVYFYKWQSNQWLYLGSELTDVYGNIVMRLVEDKSYKLIIKDDNCDTLKEIELTLTCQSLPCSYDIILSESSNPYEHVEDLSGFLYSWDYDKDTKIETFDYDYTGDALYYVNLVTYKKNVATENVEICDTLSYNDSATLTCNVSAYDTGSFISYAYVTDTLENTYTLPHTFDMSNAPQIFGKEGLLWGILILVTIFFAFIFNPIAGIFAVIMGIAVLAIIGLAALPWLFIVLIIVVGAIIIIKLKT